MRLHGRFRTWLARARRATGRLVGCSVELEGAIYVSSVSQFDYENNELRIPYLVDNPVLSLPHAISVAAPGKLLAAGWPGIFPKQFDPANQTLPVLLCGNSQKLLSG